MNLGKGIGNGNGTLKQPTIERILIQRNNKLINKSLPVQKLSVGRVLGLRIWRGDVEVSKMELDKIDTHQVV